jgi:DNA-binding beta-propeller fold protein YncE
MNPKTRIRVTALLCLALLAPCQCCAAASLFGTVTGQKLIREFDADTGAVLNSFPFPPGIGFNSVGGDGLAFGGGDLFFASIDLSQKVHRLDPATGAMRGTIVPPIGIFDALGYGQTSLGPTLFVNSVGFGRIYLLDPLTGAQKTFLTPTFSPNGGMDFSPTRGTLFVSASNGRVYEIEPTTGAVISSFATDGRAFGIAFVGARMFVSESTPTRVTERDPATGAILHVVTTAGIGGLAGREVPEPTTGLLVLAALALLRRRRTYRK